jgi:hypothetical protein
MFRCFASSCRIGAAISAEEDRRRHLVEQRLKYMVVAPVDQDDLGVRMPQRARRGNPGKSTADDDDALAPSAGRRDNGGSFVRPSLGQ